MALEEIRYSYRASPTLWAFSQSQAFVRGLMGPFRSGKSSACVIEIIRRAREQRKGADGIRRTRWIVVRNTMQELRDTTVKTFMMWVPEGKFGDFNQTSLTYTITGFAGCHIEVMFRALDRPEHIKHLLSLEVTGAWVNEAREIPWSIINALQGRVAQYPSKAEGGCTWGGLFMDTNPPDTTSDWYKFFETKSLPRSFAEIYKQPSGLDAKAENIQFINFGRTYYERLCHDKDQEWINVYIHGQYGFVKDGRSVFPQYNDEVHCKEFDPVKGVPIQRGLDWGLTPACIFSQMMPDGRWLIFDEQTSDDISIDDFLDHIQDYSQEVFPSRVDFIDTGDPAGNIRSQWDARSIFQMARGKGFNIQPGLQSPKIRLESVRRPLRRLIMGKPQFIIHPRCVKLRKGFLGGYHYRKLRVSGERYSDEPNKNEYSHPHDALQYTATRLFGGALLDPNHDNPANEQISDEEAWPDHRSEETGY